MSGRSSSVRFQLLMVLAGALSWQASALAQSASEGDAGTPPAPMVAPRATPEAAGPPPSSSDPNPAPGAGAEGGASASDAARAADDSSAADLAAVLGEVPSDGPSFQIYGFADFNVGRPYFDKKNPTSAIFKSAAFAIGNVNVYLASNLTHGFSSLVEVRLTFMPAGNFEPSGKIQTTYVADSSSYGRFDTWGGIILQRVHLDYSYNGMLNVRAGQFLTPYGIWNVDHGSPTVISNFRPYPIGNAYFPERQTGLEVFGSYLIKNTTLGYHLTASNGRGDVESTDFDKNKAIGARMFVASDVLGSLKVGLSAYGGRATRNVSLVPSGSAASAGSLPKLSLSSTNQYDEFALAADLLWEWKGLRVQGEAIMSQVRYTKAGRRLRTTELGTPIGFVPDHIAWAWYGLIGYRLPWLSIMPYVLIDQVGQPAGAGQAAVIDLGKGVIGYNVGLNVRPIPSVVLKAQLTWVDAERANSDLILVGGQVAWAF